MTEMNNGKTSKNYYIWLDLPVDKPERDVSRLLKRLDEKITSWRGASGPDAMFYTSRSGKYQDIRKELESEASLNTLIRQAQDEVIEEFDGYVKIIVDSKDILLPTRSGIRC